MNLSSFSPRRAWLRAVLRLIIVTLVILVLVQTADPLLSKRYRRQLDNLTNGLEFNFFLWEWQALVNKLGIELAAPQDTLSPEQRQQVVRDYFAAMSRTRVLRSDITRVYSRYEGQEAVTRASSLERELARQQEELARRQNLVEGILEEQVSAVLQEAGFGRWGYVLPPVKFRFTPLPLLLVTSDRAQITRAGDVHLQVGLPLTVQESLEVRVDAAFEDKRTLVTPIGGLSAYPSMVLETDSLVWLTDTFAHEWAHHLLMLHPLGLAYSDSSEMTSVNETTASIIGREIGRQVILAYYPELAGQLPPLPAPPAEPPMTSGEVIIPEEAPPDVFDYNREMRQTRLQVDELLAAGQVEQAETYMELRRLFFVEHGHNIRKLNQAYFAFYGSYATSPSTGNPIGGQLEWLRARHPSLRDFVSTVGAVSSYEEFLDLLR